MCRREETSVSFLFFMLDQSHLQMILVSFGTSNSTDERNENKRNEEFREKESVITERVGN